MGCSGNARQCFSTFETLKGGRRSKVRLWLPKSRIDRHNLTPLSPQSQTLLHSLSAAVKRPQKSRLADCSMTNDSLFVQTLTRTSEQVHEPRQRNENQNVRPQLNQALRHIQNPRPITLIHIPRMGRQIALVWFGVATLHTVGPRVKWGGT